MIGLRSFYVVPIAEVTALYLGQSYPSRAYLAAATTRSLQKHLVNRLG